VGQLEGEAPEVVLAGAADDERSHGPREGYWNARRMASGAGGA